MEACNEQQCGCIDCTWGEWSVWSDCDCTGLRSRSRAILSHANDCGTPCDGVRMETEKCEPDCLLPPHDCHMSEWDSWSECIWLALSEESLGREKWTKSSSA